MSEPARVPGNAWRIALVVVSLVGLLTSLYLTRLHLQLFYGGEVGTALCDFGEGFSCSAVNASAESELYGIPQALLAIPLYLVTAGLALLPARRRASGAAVLGAIGLFAVLYSARLAWVSATVIGAWCLFCMVLYAVNLALLGLGLGGVGWRPGRWLVRLREALPELGGSVGVGLLLLGISWLGYSQVRGGMAAEAAAKAVIEAAAQEPAPKAPKTEAAEAQLKKVRLGVAQGEVEPPKDAPVLGAAKPSVRIVELGDFQCPFCKRLAGTLHQLVEEYPDSVQLTFVHYPLNLDCTHAELKKSMHPEACHASAAAVCAQAQGHFWEMHDALWDHQGELGQKTYLALADELGLDGARFASCLEARDTQATILDGTRMGADLGVTGTPTFYVNGRRMAGAQPIEVLRAVVDAELAGNKEALALEVEVGTEETGAVEGAATTAVAGMAGVDIDSFEASLEGEKAASRPGVAPAREISWFDAAHACEAAGRRLCTEQEWLAACTGEAPEDVDHNGIVSDDPIRGLSYGYADRRHEGACADSRDPANPGELLTGNHPKCGTPTGVYDLVGGVKEWVGLSPATAAVKGGSYSSGESARCGYYRDDIAPDTEDAATGFRCCGGDPHPAPTPVAKGRDVGEALAAFSVPDLDGKQIDSASLVGKPLVLTFWASWCGPCQKEMPALAEVYERYKDQGLTVLGISVDKEESKLRGWLAKHPMPFQIGRDPASALMDEFPNRGLPTTLWVRKDGTIRLRTTGVPPGGERRIEELVTELLGIPAPERASSR